MGGMGGGGGEYVLTLSCPDKPGIVYAVASFLVQHSGNILASQQYGQQYGQQYEESPDGRFFMRVHFTVPPGTPLTPELQLAGLERDFSWVAEAYQMSWQLHDKAARVRTLIMVSRLGHCLNDLLFRWKTGALPIDVEGRMINIHHRSCRASRAPSLTTRPTRGASSWSAPPHTT